MTQCELADRVGLSRKTVNHIIQGSASITAETALKLETALGVPAQFWLSMDAQYQEFLARKAQRASFQPWISWLQRIPYKEMALLGWVPEASTAEEQIGAALSYYGTATPAAWEACWAQWNVSYRKSKLATADLGILSAWLRKGELDAQKITTQAFHPERFRGALKEIRTLLQTPPEVFQPEMRRLCADAGVAVVLTPELKKLRVNGAMYWLASEKALVQLSLLYKSQDHFWFTFFHEAAHVLEERKKGCFMEGIGVDDEAERAANDFACDILIPRQHYHKFVCQRDFCERRVKRFAEELAIPPGIVVGRLQHDKKLRYHQLNHLKLKFVWAQH